MLHTKIKDIKDNKLSIGEAEKFISSSDFGASIFFSGTVRNQNNNKSVIGITYDSHDSLVIKSFEEIYNEADKKLSLEEAEQFISSSDFGASIFMSGTVRNHNNNKSVTGITYDSHDSLVIKSFEEIYNEADQKLNIKNKAVFIEHAKGYLNLGEISIIIAVACKHRDEAYILSRYIIEEIKKRSPIWKKEHYQNNETDWLKGNPIQYEKN